MDRDKARDTVSEKKFFTDEAEQVVTNVQWSIALQNALVVHS